MTLPEIIVKIGEMLDTETNNAFVSNNSSDDCLVIRASGQVSLDLINRVADAVPGAKNKEVTIEKWHDEGIEIFIPRKIEVA